jgi:hypothetical protein
VPPFIQNGRTFIPLWFVSENLEASIEYDTKTQEIEEVLSLVLGMGNQKQVFHFPS